MASSNKVTYIQFFQKLRQLIKDDKFNWIGNAYKNDNFTLEMLFNDDIISTHGFSKGNISKNELMVKTFKNNSYEINGEVMDYVILNKKLIHDVYIDEKGDLVALEPEIGADIMSHVIGDVEDVKHIIGARNRKFDNIPKIQTSNSAYKITKLDLEHVKKYGAKEIAHNDMKLIFPNTFIMSKKVDTMNETFIDFHDTDTLSVINIINKQFFVFKTKLDLNFINY